MAKKDKTQNCLQEETLGPLQPHRGSRSVSTTRDEAQEGASQLSAWHHPSRQAQWVSLNHHALISHSLVKLFLNPFIFPAFTIFWHKNVHKFFTCGSFLFTFLLWSYHGQISKGDFLPECQWFYRFQQESFQSKPLQSKRLSFLISWYWASLFFLPPLPYYFFMLLFGNFSISFLDMLLYTGQITFCFVFSSF